MVVYIMKVVAKIGGVNQTIMTLTRGIWSANSLKCVVLGQQLSLFLPIDKSNFKNWGHFRKVGVHYHIMTPPNPRPGRGRPPIMHSTILRDIIDAKHYSLLRGTEGSTNQPNSQLFWLGLYWTSRPSQKYRKVWKSGLSGNWTFSFPDIGPFTLLKIDFSLFFNFFFSLFLYFVCWF